MTTHPPTGSCWYTAALGASPDTSPTELQTLRDHLGTCQAVRGRLFALRCGTDAVCGFLAMRTVTTLALLVTLAVLTLAWA
jgi:hypothetical protein